MKTGTISWIDLSVAQADLIRDFYAQVVGWRAESVNMGEYDDYNMLPDDAEHPAAGICHARGVNADLPAMWIIYISVNDLDAAIDQIRVLGGEVLDERRQPDGAGLCIFRDPAGAVAAVYKPGDPNPGN
jgi:predicted enzyme related to lactoylglutathione lyase